MKGDFHPLMRWRDVDLVDGVLSAETVGWMVAVESKCLPLLL